MILIRYTIKYGYVSCEEHEYDLFTNMFLLKSLPTNHVMLSNYCSKCVL